MCSQHAEVYPYFIYFVNFFINGKVSKLPEFKRLMTVNLLTFAPSDDKNVPIYSCVEPLCEQSCVCSCTANFGATMVLSRELKSLATSESLKSTNAFFLKKKKKVLRSTLRAAKNTVRERNICFKQSISCFILGAKLDTVCVLGF